MDKTKVLLISDSIQRPTGVAIQSLKLCEGLLKTGKYQVIQIAGGDRSSPSAPIYFKGVKLYTTEKPYGDPQLLRYIMAADKPDIVIAFSDPRFFTWLFQMDNEIRDRARLVFYHTWDNYPFPKFNLPWYASCDEVIMLSHFSYNLMQSNGVKCRCIPHGMDPTEFYPLDEASVSKARQNFIAQSHAKGPVNFVIFWNNRNIYRKRPGDVLWAYKSFSEKYPDSMLVLNTDIADREGIDLMHFIDDHQITAPIIFNPQRIPSHQLNVLYNISDVTVNIALNEGFGLCVLPTTSIYTENGIKEIQYLSLQDRVLTHTGNYEKVTNIMPREADETVIEITPRFISMPVTMSKNDKVFAIKGKTCFPSQKRPCYPYCKKQFLPPGNCKKVFEDYKPEWINSTELKKGDILLFPKEKFIEENPVEFDLAEFGVFDYTESFIQPYGSRVKQLPRYIIADEGLFRLLGYYLAEGSHTNNQIEFAFHKKEKFYGEDVIFLMQKYFGLNDAIVRYHNNVLSIRYTSIILVEFFTKLLGAIGPQKELNSVLFNSPINLLKELLKGYWRGDGCFSENSYLFSTSSKRLAYQIFLILQRFNILPCLRKSLHQSEKGNALMYTITGERSALYYLDDNKPEENNRNDMYWQDENYFYVPIRKVREYPYRGLLYDITVNNDHSFAAEGMILHNCVAESLCAGTPVIVTETGGMIEQARAKIHHSAVSSKTETDGKSCPEHDEIIEYGRVLPPDARSMFGTMGAPYIFQDIVDSSTLVKAFEEAYKRTKEGDWKKTLGPIGREHIIQNFHIDTTIKLWDELLQELIKKPSSYNRWSVTTI